MTGVTLTISLCVKSKICSIILRSRDWAGHEMVDMSCCTSHAAVRISTCGPEHCHVEIRMDDFCRQISFLQILEGFLAMFWHWYVTVPVYRSGSRLHAWSLACVSQRWFRGIKFLSVECTCFHYMFRKHRHLHHEKFAKQVISPTYMYRELNMHF